MTWRHISEAAKNVIDDASAAMKRRVTAEEIEAGKSPAGGWNKAQLADWGVPWPPPKGWKEALLAGKTMKEAGLQYLEPSPIRPEMSAHELLRQVVLAVIEADQGRILYDYPDVLAYFGGRVPPKDGELPL